MCLRAKNTKNMKLSAIFGGFQGLNHPYYHMSGPLVNILKHFICLFLVGNGCLNCLKIVRFEDLKKIQFDSFGF